jgi:hypothetical protein
MMFRLSILSLVDLLSLKLEETAMEPLFYTAVAAVPGAWWLTRAWRKLRSRNVEVLHIRSDRETRFLHATVSGKSGPKPAVAIPHPHHPDWDMADSVFKDIAESQWLADATSLTKDEAISGGTYTFERKFDVPQGASIVSAELVMLVDNWSVPTINGVEFVRKGGKVVEHIWDIKSRVTSGENTVTFDVINNPGVQYLSDDDRWPEWNPYGFKYLIRVGYRR